MYCGNPISSNDKFCTYCGHKVQDNVVNNQSNNISSQNELNSKLYSNNYFKWFFQTLIYPSRENNKMFTSKYFGIISIVISFILSSFITIESLHYTEMDSIASDILDKLKKGYISPFNDNDKGAMNTLLHDSNSDQATMINIYFKHIYSTVVNYNIATIFLMFLLLILILVFARKLFYPNNMYKYTDIINDFAIRSNWTIVIEFIAIIIIPFSNDADQLMIVVFLWYVILLLYSMYNNIFNESRFHKLSIGILTVAFYILMSGLSINYFDNRINHQVDKYEKEVVTLYNENE